MQSNTIIFYMSLFKEQMYLKIKTTRHWRPVLVFSRVVFEDKFDCTENSKQKEPCLTHQYYNRYTTRIKTLNWDKIQAKCVQTIEMQRSEYIITKQINLGERLVKITYGTIQQQNNVGQLNPQAAWHCAFSRIKRSTASHTILVPHNDAPTSYNSHLATGSA